MQSNSGWNACFWVFLGGVLRLGTLLDHGEMVLTMIRALRFRQIARQSLFNSARSRCRPSLFICNRRVFSSSSVTIITLVSTILVRLWCLQEQGRQRIPIFESVSVSVAVFFFFAMSGAVSSLSDSLQVSLNVSTVISVKEQRDRPVIRLEPIEVQHLNLFCFLFPRCHDEVHLRLSPGSVQLLVVYSSCSEFASIHVFVTVRSRSATTVCVWCSCAQGIVCVRQRFRFQN